MDPSEAERQNTANRRAAWFWGTFVVGLLSLQVTGGVIAILLASGDESVAVVPDYYQKALKWDQEVALRAASDRLGWTAHLDQIGGGDGLAGLRIQVRDQDGQRVDFESGTLEIYRHFRAGNVRRVALPAASAGDIELPNCFDASGLWQVSLDIQDDQGNRFVASMELNIGLTAGRGA
jgi:nitrogen fixation protein FixH